MAIGLPGRFRFLQIIVPTTIPLLTVRYRPALLTLAFRCTNCSRFAGALPVRIYRGYRRPHLDSGMGQRILLFLKDEAAATAIEYSLIAAGIALAIIPMVTGVGTHLKTIFSSVSSAVK